jgi:hypothetical protein
MFEMLKYRSFRIVQLTRLVGRVRESLGMDFVVAEWTSTPGSRLFTSYFGHFWGLKWGCCHGMQSTFQRGVPSAMTLIRGQHCESTDFVHPIK